jgi:glutamate-1-semialdehyde 2,1-aminomutase
MATTSATREQLLARARAVLPNGVSSGGRAKFDQTIVRARGAYVWSADGTRYIDYLLAYGPIVVGHCDPRVNEAVARAAATCDLNWVGPQAGEMELAEQICELMPSAEKVAFCTSGTDASLHAVHLARAATGRVKLLKFHGSYHGWHDQLAVGSRLRAATGDEGEVLNEPDALGLHPGAVADVLVVEWNDVAGLRRAFAQHGEELAAVFAEPYVHSYGCVPPGEGWLGEIRQLTAARGAVLVFDEIKTGFRHGLGGYQEVCGVTPDLSIFGKALGNGYSIAGVAGRSSILDLLGSASERTATIEGTYNASPYALAAGLATLEVLRDGGIERLYALGESLRAGLAGAIAAAGAPACVTGWGSEWMVYFAPEPPRSYREVLSTDLELHERFRRAMLDEGILEPPFATSDKRLCVALSESDVDETVEAAARALAAVA